MRATLDYRPYDYATLVTFSLLATFCHYVLGDIMTRDINSQVRRQKVLATLVLATKDHRTIFVV
jgi:hypothetical protein